MLFDSGVLRVLRSLLRLTPVLNIGVVVLSSWCTVSVVSSDNELSILGFETDNSRSLTLSCNRETFR